MQMKNLLYKARCSEIGLIMTNDRSGKGMGKTVETHLQKWVKSKLYGIEPDIYSKYMDKGTRVEQESIEFAAEYLGWGMCFKNEQHYQNEFITGTPDLVFPGIVRDMKNSWDHETFPLFDEEPPKDNYWQMQGYMDLTGADLAEVVYTLMNTPEDLVFGEPADYSELPASLRVKTFRVDRNQADIESVYRRVELCRDYVNWLINKL